MGEYFEKTKQKTLNWQLLTSWNTEEGQIASLIKTPQTSRTAKMLSQCISEISPQYLNCKVLTNEIFNVKL